MIVTICIFVSLEDSEAWPSWQCLPAVTKNLRSGAQNFGSWVGRAAARNSCWVVPCEERGAIITRRIGLGLWGGLGTRPYFPGNVEMEMCAQKRGSLQPAVEAGLRDRRPLPS